MQTDYRGRRFTIRLVFAAAACLCAAIGCRSRSDRDYGPDQDGGPEASDRDARRPQTPELISLLGTPLYADPPGDDRAKLEADLEAARADLRANPADPEKIVWAGRRLGYLWRMHEAIDVFTEGTAIHPEYAPLYRHRGHRYISLREFDLAIADLQKAAELIRGQPDQIEQDGMPNAENIPLTSLAFNIYYHLGLARYLKGDFEGALEEWVRTTLYLNGHDDNLVAVSDWMYMTLRRLGRDEEATALLDPIRPAMRIIENTAYHRRCLMYKGLIKPKELLDPKGTNALDWATQGYGVGNWYLYNDEKRAARKTFEKVVEGPYWPAFGYIACEVELARMRGK